MDREIPAYSHADGISSNESDDKYWYILLKSSGTLTFQRKKTIDVILIGGGGSGKNGTGGTLYGGASGHVVKQTGVQITAKTGYPIEIGAGGKRGSDKDGESTTAFGYTAKGGDSGAKGGPNQKGFAKGGDANNKGEDGFLPFESEKLEYVCGGGGGGWYTANEWGNGGGTAGGNGGGGHGGYLAIGGADAKENTGGGGGAGGRNPNGWYGEGGAGGSGLVVIRGTQDDELPVTFNGVELEQITFNGVEISSLIFNGKTVF